MLEMVAELFVVGSIKYFNEQKLIEVDLKTVNIFKRSLRNVYRDINPLLPSAAYMGRRAKILILI